MRPATTPSLVHRVCTICEANCGIRVHTEGGSVTRIEGDPDDPFSRGHICPKAHGLIELQNDPDRIRQPMRKTEQGFEPISWDEALDFAATRLGEIKEANGIDAIALYRGNPTSHDSEALLYWNALETALPTRSRFSAGSLDTWPRWVQAGLMYGGFLSTPIPDVDHCDYLLMLGANPIASNGSLMTAPGIKKRLGALRDRGGRLVVIDPRRSETADLADEHHFIRPGGDAALLFGMVHVLFEEGLIDTGAAGEHLNDLGTIRKLAKAYPPARVAGFCGVEEDTIRRLARDLAAAPRAAVYGRMGTSVQRFGTLAHWAIDLLNILTGNLDRKGGVLFPKPAASLAFAGKTENNAPPFGRVQSPVSGYDEIQGEWPVAALAEEIESEREDRIRALVIIAGNPASSAPNAERVGRALGSLECMVAIDYYINETTRHADLILPPTTPLEHAGYDVALLHFAIRNSAKWSPAALPLPTGQPPLWRALIGLAKRLMGLGAMEDEAVDDLLVGQLIGRVLDDTPLAGAISPETVQVALGDTPGPRRLIDLLLRAGPYGDHFGRKPGGLTVAALEASVHGLDLGALQPALPEPIQTPSGRIELAPARLVGDLERLDGAIDAEGPADGMLLIGRRDIRSMNSWLHNLPSLTKGPDRCTLQICSQDAARLGLDKAGQAKLAGRIGQVVVPVEISDRMAPGVVSLPHGWGHNLPGVQLSVASELAGVNTNLVVDDQLVDAPSGTSVLNGIPVEISPA